MAEIELLEPAIEKEAPTPAPIVEAAAPAKKADFKLLEPTQPAKAAAESKVEPVKETPKEEPKETPKETVKADNEIDFGLTPKEDTKEVAKEAVKPSTDWKDAIKSIDKAELLKELGIEDDDEFEKEFKKFRRNGGDPYKYLEAKSKDWSKVDDRSLAMKELSELYPSLTSDELQIMFDDKYRQDEFASDEDKKIGAVLLKADASRKRQAEIEAQKKFTIPENATVNPSDAVKQYQDELVKQQEQNIAQSYEDYKQHPSTKALVESKKVVIPAGEFGSFNIAVNPDEIVGYFTNPEVFRKYSFTAEGKPDVAKEQALAMIKIIGLEKYNETLIRYGRQQATKSLIEEGQNVEKPKAQPNVEKKVVQWRST